MSLHRRLTPLVLTALLLLPAAAGAAPREFSGGSLIIPMDLTYQDRGLFQAYGLLFQLLRQGITVHWVIDPGKVWHHAPCDAVGDLCDWDCEEEGATVGDGELAWSLGNLGAQGSTTPPASGSRWFEAAFPALGDYNLEAELTYRVGVSDLRVTQPVTVRVLLDSDGDLVPDELDPWPLDPERCGDDDGDGCDDCAAEGSCDPDPDAGPDGGDGDPKNASGDCSCRAGQGSGPVTALWFVVVCLLALGIRRRRR
jgi:MYXO-CTERM domain-containing protein